MPGMWEAEMRLDKSSLESRGEKGFGKWDEFTVCLSTIPRKEKADDQLSHYL